MNNVEKTNMRTMAIMMRDGKHILQTLRVKDTGSNKYTVCIENLPNNTLQYSVIKHNKAGKLIGRLVIDRVNIYGLEYNNSIIGSLPLSIIRYIRAHYTIFCNYLKIGESAFL